MANQGTGYQPLMDKNPPPQDPLPQQPPPYPQQQGYPSAPQGYPPAPQGYPPAPQGYPQQGYPSYPQQQSNVTVVTTPPTTTYVSGSTANNQDHLVLPTVGLVFSFIQLTICLSLLNLVGAACLIPAFVCAAIGLGASPEKAKLLGQMSIGFNIFNIVFWIISIILICIIVPVVLINQSF